ncbi:hypothetical protein CA13_72110 [Planctomycetes bacterium CA13]|uniref:Uncharacterized protein n=1 Tax=Novipirellula herctigrandis TaxID=2527986 RepID=A0A5C5YPC4_9BACT|nr:hypothetical protein CA13_72110 [Planctomycetes bacterium CA13]
MPLLPKGGQMAIRSLILPQTRINAQSGVAETENAMNHSMDDCASLPPGELVSSAASGSSKLTRKSRRSRRAIRAVMLAGLSIAIVGSTGCTMFSGVCKSVQQTEALDEFMIGHRNRVMAAKAWHCQKHQFCNPSSAFKDGFIEGYMDVANGGNGCIPSVAPSKYWGWAYQSANGQSAVNDWFAGYPMGVKAAEQDGVGHWNQIQTGRMPMNAAPMAIPAMMAAPALSDNDIGLDLPQSPFVDDNTNAAPMQEGTPAVQEEDTGSSLQDVLELREDAGAMMFNDDQGYSFSASSSDIPELEPRPSSSSSPAKAHSDSANSDTVASADINDVIDSIFGTAAIAEPVSDASNSKPEAKSATKSSAADLPFSFQ